MRIDQIHWQNLANFGVLPPEFTDTADYDRIEQGDQIALAGLHDVLRKGDDLQVRNLSKNESYGLRHSLSARQRDAVLAGGRIPLHRARA